MAAPRRPKSLNALVYSQAGIRIRLTEYLRAQPQILREVAIRSSLLLGSFLFRQPLMFVAGVIILIPIYLKYRRTSEFCYRGETHAARIISLNPPLVAFYGDLARASLDPMPVIVIADAQLQDINFNIQSGDRIPLIAKASGGDFKSFTHLDSMLPSSFIHNAAILDAMLDSIPDWQWEDLDEALFDVPQPYEPGVYSLVQTHSRV